MADTTGVVQTKTAVKDLLDAGVHFGHQTKRWNPKMKRYIFGERNGIYIIDLAKSLALLRIAQEFVYETVLSGRNVLFVGTKKQAQEPLKETADRLKQHYVTHRWLGGMLTNNETIRNSVSRMRELEKMDQDDGFKSVGSKKEAARLRRELVKLQRNLSGIADMTKLPGALFIVDINREHIAVAEARKLNIPVIALVDTNTDPELVDYPIPSNDDAIRAIRLMSKVLGDTILQASNEYAKRASEEIRRKAAAEAEAKAKAKAEREARRVKEEAARKARADESGESKPAKAKAEPKAKKAEPKAEKAAPKAKAEPKVEKVAPKAKAEPKAEKAAPKAKKAEPKAEAKVEEPKVAAKAEEPKAAEAPAEKAEAKSE